MKPKLLIFINTLSMGGAERVVSHLIWNLRDNFEIHLALYSRLIEYDIPSDIPILDMGQPLDQKPFITFCKIPWLSYKLFRYCRKNKIDTSVAFLNRPCYINALMRTLWGFRGRIIMCERTYQTTILASNSRLFRMVSRRLVAFSYKKADLVLVNSYASKHDLAVNIGVRKPMQVIYNPVDIEMVKKKMHESCTWERKEGFFYFISVGGFRREKNLPLLLDALFIIKHLPVKLILVGSGPLHSELVNKTKELGLAEQVLFAGFDKNPFRHLNQADCYVLSSYVEGFPNVLLEALACELPVISTDCMSGPRELLAPGTDLHHSLESSYEIAAHGILTPSQDVTNLAAAMRKMVEDRELRQLYRSRAMSRVSAFDVSEIIQYFHVAFSGL